MTGRKRILLYGNSIVLGGVGASLRRWDGFELTCCAAPLPGPAELDALAPDVIIFDIENGHPEAAFALLENRSDLLLLGISPDGNVVRQWSGRQYSQLSTKELMALIEAASSEAAPDELLVHERGRSPVERCTGGIEGPGRES